MRKLKLFFSLELVYTVVVNELSILGDGWTHCRVADSGWKGLYNDLMFSKYRFMAWRQARNV